MDERGALAAVENDEFEHVPGRVGTPDEVAKGVFGDLFDGGRCSGVQHVLRGDAMPERGAEHLHPLSVLRKVVVVASTVVGPAGGLGPP